MSDTIDESMTAATEQVLTSPYPPGMVLPTLGINTAIACHAGVATATKDRVPIDIVARVAGGYEVRVGAATEVGRARPWLGLRAGEWVAAWHAADRAGCEPQ